MDPVPQRLSVHAPIFAAPPRSIPLRTDLLPIVGPPEGRVFRLLPRWRAGRAGGSHEGSRGLVADGAMRPVIVVVAAPILQLFAGVGKGQEPMLSVADDMSGLGSARSVR